MLNQKYYNHAMACTMICTHTRVVAVDNYCIRFVFKVLFNYAFVFVTTLRCITLKHLQELTVGEMCDRLATIDMGRKWGAAVPHSGGRGGQLGPHLTHCCLSRGLPAYQVAS